jgi:NADPH:quinone reductase-like Zn-dependent oxidoreductase
MIRLELVANGFVIALRLQRVELPKLDADRLLVKLLATPINPSDINQIQGVYPLKPQLPKGIGGNEGVFAVEAVGEKCAAQGWKVGDRVIPSKSLFGNVHYRRRSPASVTSSFFQAHGERMPLPLRKAFKSSLRPSVWCRRQRSV